MPFYNTLEYEGEYWRYVFLNSDPSLDEEINIDVIWNVIDMHKKEEAITRRIKKDDFWMDITPKDETTIGMLAGKSFDVEINTDYGESRLAILLMDKIPKHKLN